MLITLHFKTPDVVDDAVDRLVSEVEDQETADAQATEIKDKLSKWVKYGECLTVEFDLDEMVARVV